MRDAARRCLRAKCRCSTDGDKLYCSDWCATHAGDTKTVCLCSHACCLLECDLVMKGGITSGIVYPPLVLKLRDAYRFRCVGGTSSGAVAAAATAAAEYGRDAEGFDKLRRLQEELSDGTFLRDLFQPSKETRPLMRFLFSLLDIFKSKRSLLSARLIGGVVWALLRALPLTFAAGAALGIAVSWLLAWLLGGSLRGLGLLIPILLGVIGAAIASLLHLVLLFVRTVPDNLIGLCTGRKGDLKEAPDVLTDWLNDRINDIAGLKTRPDPLTFGDLRTKPFWDGRTRSKEDNITLRMVTSNLSQNQPYILPFQDHLFVFKKTEFSKLFPPQVITYLEKENEFFKEYQASVKPSHYSLPADFYFLPAADKLPVIVATRLSLSFPLLLSAVPLYTMKPEKITEEKSRNHEQPHEQVKHVAVAVDDLQVNWFSDGGICSNFPIQFFDRWLPTRPTFGVNLTSLPEEGLTDNKTRVKPEFMSPTSSELKAPPNRQAIYLPKADDCLATELIPFARAGTSRPSLLKFLWAIFSTAKNYRDNAQSVLPSYRERIVQIRLSDNEGGLNLAMPGDTIENVVVKGETAGQTLLDDFRFDVHQWVRFRVLMKQIESSLTQMNDVMSSHQIYSDLLKGSVQPSEYPYACDEEWLKQIVSRLQRMGEEIHGWEPRDLFANEPLPIPEPVLRVTPEL